MGCSGTCTTSNSSLCWEALKPSVEIVLKKYKKIVEDFKQKTTDANENIVNLENTVQESVSIFENKIGTINECQVNFENLEKEQYKYQVLSVSSQQRKELVSIANDLNEFATEFLSSQPSFFRKMSTNTEQNVVDQSAE